MERPSPTSGRLVGTGISHAIKHRGNARNVSTTLATSLAIQLLNAATGIALARALGPDQRGSLALMVVTAWVLVLIVSVGTSESVAYFGASTDLRSSFVAGTLLRLTIVQAIIGVACGVVVMHVVLGSESATERHWGYVFIAFVALNLFVQQITALLRAYGDFRLFNLVRFGFTAVSAIPIVVLAFLGSLTLVSALCTYLAAGAVTVMAGVARLLQLRLCWRFEWETARQLLGFGVKSYAGTVPSLLNERLDQLLVGVFIGTRELGLYAAAVSLTSGIVIVGQSVALVALPALAAIRSGVERRRRGNSLLAFAAIASATLAACGALAAPWLVPELFGSSFAPSIVCTQILFGASFVLSMNRALAALLRADNRPGRVGISEAIALAATVIALATLTPTFGIVGAALASVIAYSVSLALMTVMRRAPSMSRREQVEVAAAA